MIKNFTSKRILIAIICSLLINFLACQNGVQADNDALVIHTNYFADDRGLVYDDNRVGFFKCYFDINSMTNIYFCTRPNCDHTALECNSRLCHPYSFFIGDDQYYIEKNMK